MLSPVRRLCLPSLVLFALLASSGAYAVGQTLEDLKAKDADLEAKNSSLVSRVSALEAKLAALVTKDADLEAKNSGLVSRVTTLEAKLAALATKDADLEARVETLNSEVGPLKTQVGAFQSRVAALEASKFNGIVVGPGLMGSGTAVAPLTIAPAGVGSEQLADGSVTLAKLATTNGKVVGLDADTIDGHNASEFAKTTDVAGTAALLALQSQVTTTQSKLASLSLADLAGTIDAARLTGTIPTSSIGAGSITGDKLADGSVTGPKIASGSVSASSLDLSAYLTKTEADAKYGISAGAGLVLSGRTISIASPLSLPGSLTVGGTISGDGSGLTNLRIPTATNTNAGLISAADISRLNNTVMLNPSSPQAGFIAVTGGAFLGGSLRVGTGPSDPSGAPGGGFIYYNTNSRKLRYYDGTNWLTLQPSF